MPLSPSFQAQYQEWSRRLEAREITEAEVALIAKAVIGELDHLEVSFRTGRINAASLATGKQQVRDLLESVLRQEGLCRQEQDKIRHLIIDRFPFELLDIPGFRFSHDWFYYHIDQWESHFGGLATRPNLRFIEIGCFEGRSTCWMLQNLLTGVGSQVVCIDPFDRYQSQERNFDFNIEATGHASKVTKLRGRSRAVLPFLSEGSYDFVYVDGSHLALDVMCDAAMAWGLLKVGGIIVFDDYENGHPLFADAFMAKQAIDAFLNLIAGQYEVIFQHSQVAISKLSYAGSETALGTGGPSGNAT